MAVWWRCGGVCGDACAVGNATTNIGGCVRVCVCGVYGRWAHQVVVVVVCVCVCVCVVPCWLHATEGRAHHPHRPRTTHTRAHTTRASTPRTSPHIRAPPHLPPLCHGQASSTLTQATTRRSGRSAPGDGYHPLLARRPHGHASHPAPCQAPARRLPSPYTTPLPLPLPLPLTSSPSAASSWPVAQHGHAADHRRDPHHLRGPRRLHPRPWPAARHLCAGEAHSGWAAAASCCCCWLLLLWWWWWRCGGGRLARADKCVAAAAAAAPHLSLLCPAPPATCHTPSPPSPSPPPPPPQPPPHTLFFLLQAVSPSRCMVSRSS